MNPWNWEFYSSCGVDSGQLGFFDFDKYPIGVKDMKLNITTQITGIKKLVTKLIAKKIEPEKLESLKLWE